MVFPPAAHRSPVRATRKDGEDSRQRLLLAALRLFAEQGYAKTSTRELAEAAGVNIAAISYYFGDKAGLYRAAFMEPQGAPADAIARFADPALALPDALAAFYAGFLEPMRHGDIARHCLKLHVREMVEPTGLWDEEVQQVIKPMHDALVALLARHLGLQGPARATDDDLQRLAICLASLGVHQHVGCDVTETLAPGLYSQPDSFDRWSRMLVRSAAAMVEAERRHRAGEEHSR
jgi:TetR/AcrR family transcriptional regulator, regulator of cefoperazone and chloramphenicol sensitivity